MNNNNNSNGNSNNVGDDHKLMQSMPPAETLKQLHSMPIAEEHNARQVIKKKKKRRDKSDLGDDFVPPDGGWGWLVSIASGVNILVTFALAQQFGLIFRDHFESLGIGHSQLTTIINMQIAISAFTGLLNGPVFRRYSYRQVALVGSVLTFIGLFIIVFGESFAVYMIGFSCIYGFGRGLTVSASSLAVNTFFKKKRRTATAYQFGVAGLGPIVCPFFVNYLLMILGVRGTVLIFAGLSLHTIACSLIYQPVKWHVIKQEKDAEALKSEHKQQDDNDDEHGHIIKQVAEPDTPVLPRANDGWFGSSASVSSSTRARSRLSSFDSQQPHPRAGMELKRLNSKDSNVYSKPRSFSTSHSIKEEQNDEDEHAQYTHNNELQRLAQDAAETKLMPTQQLQYKTEKSQPINNYHNEDDVVDDEEEQRKKLPFYKKVVIFFDLDLLRDITYVNLAVGITLINFVEINFAILTPFILTDFGFTKSQTATAMSTLGFCDLVIRFLIPLITAKMNFSNKTFFIVGILGMCIGRILLSFTRDLYMMLAIFVWLGLNKAFRTVFWSLIIPGYVPLKRLPAAAGLQLLMSGTFSVVFGPLIGVLRQNTDYAFTLNFLNALCILAIALWLIEDFIRNRHRKSKPVTDADFK